MKRIILIISIVTIFLQANGQYVDKKDNSLVWEITNANTKKTSYVVFTTSGTCNANPALLAKVSQLRNDINSYYTETGIGNPKNEKESQQYAFINSPDESIKNLIDYDSYSALQHQFSGLKLPDSLNKLSPIMLNGILTKTITPLCNTVNTTEGIFRKYAANYKIEVKELISVQEAFKILKSYGNSYYASQIQYMLQHKQMVAEEIAKKAELYMDGDLAGIQQLYTQSNFLGSRYAFAQIEKERIDLLAAKVNAIGKTGGVLFTLDLACIMNEKYSLFSQLKILGYDIRALND